MEQKKDNQNEIKLNLGCGGRPLDGYINVDMDTVDELRRRYPGSSNFPPGLKVYQYDIFNLPYKDGTVDEVRADSFIEHLSFIEEPKLFNEAKRVLKRGGVLRFQVPDFEAVVKAWLEAKDDWKEFYRTDDEAIAKNHWFGNYSYTVGNRWGYLTAGLYGTQNSPGQFHRNCYTEGKIRAMLKYLGFTDIEIERADDVRLPKGVLPGVHLLVRCRKI